MSSFWFFASGFALQSLSLLATAIFHLVSSYMARPLSVWALCHYNATSWKVASGTYLGQRGALTVDFPCIKGHCLSISWLCCCLLVPSNSFHPTSAFLILIKLRVGLVKFKCLHRTQKCKSNLSVLSCRPRTGLGSNSGPTCLTPAFRA